MKNSNSFTNLKNRYRAVLKKCSLINTFGALALVALFSVGEGSALAADNPGAGGSFTDAFIVADPSADPELNNRNDLSGKLVSGPYVGYVGMYGLNVTGSNVNFIFKNYASIEFTESANVAAMFAHGNGDHELTNEGTIRVKSYSSQYAYGMLTFGGSGSHTFINTAKASIFVEALDNEAYGMFTDNQPKGNHNFLNQGTINVTSVKNDAYGMYAWGAGNHQLTNSGTIFVTNTNTVLSDAEGMVADGAGDHTLINAANASITVKADSRGYGMSTERSIGSHTLTNDGEIEVTSNDHQAYGMLSWDGASGKTFKQTNNNIITVVAQEEASAMLAYGDSDNILINNGMLSATSTNKQASGMDAIGSKNTITNSGKIIVASTNDKAYGMYVGGTGTNTINNTGTITATAGNNGSAYEVYGRNDYEIGTYATTLRTWKANDAVFGADSGVSVTFDNSTLILRKGDNTELGKIYNVADMVYIDGNAQTTIDGNIGQVTTEAPTLQAHLIDGNTQSPKVSLTANVNTQTAAPVILPTASVTRFQGILAKIGKKVVNTKLQRRLARLNMPTQALYEQGVIVAGHHVPYAPSYQEHKWAIYLDAFAGYTGNSNYNTGTHEKGMTLGGERIISDKLSVGFAMGFTDAVTDGANGMTADSTALTIAANADYYINDDWYVSGKMAISSSENDLDYALSPTLYAGDDFNSKAFYLELNTGYIYEINKNNVIIPEFGLSYLYSNSDSVSLDFATSDTYDMFIKNDDFSALYSTLMVTWQGQYEISRGILTPTAGIGLRQNLTGSDFDSTVQTLGSSFDTVAKEDDTTLLTTVGLEWKNGAFAMGVSYNGDFGSDQKSHSGNVKFRYEF